MLVLSAVFYKERIIFLDTAFTIFHIVKDSSFSIQVYRFGDFFTQLFPVIGRKAGMSLNFITLSYSVGFIAYYFTCYLICGSILKQRRFAVVILLLNILFVSDTFYWITSQLPQGMALFVVLLACVADKQFPLKPVQQIILICITVLVAFYHPLMIFIVVFTILFFNGRADVFPDKRIVYYLGMIYLIAVILKATVFKSVYERHALGGLKNFILLFPDYLSLYSNGHFLQSWLTKYYWIPLIFICIAVYYVHTKEWKKLVLFTCYFMGYTALINICYPDESTPDFYIESLYLPLGYFLALPLVFDVSNRKYIRTEPVLGVFILIILSGCMRLYTTHHKYTKRLNWERNFLVSNIDAKIIIDKKKADAGILQLLWGTPYEFWLLSTIEQDKSASIIIDEQPETRQWADQHNKSLIVNWNIYPYSILDPRYFRMTDTVTTYQIIK
jgi:hypothetical protein